MREISYVLYAHKIMCALMTRKSSAVGMRNAIKVPGVGFVGVLNRPLSIYHYSNMTLKLSGQNCNFFKVSLVSQRKPDQI